MLDEAALIQQLIEAQRAGAQSVDAAALVGVDRAVAYRVQQAVMAGLGEQPGMLKTWTMNGDAAAAPIYAGRVGASGNLKLAAGPLAGFEVEIGFVLARDVPPGSDAATLEAAIGRRFMGMEICGTRFRDRSKADFETGLADNMSAHGYAIGAADWTGGDPVGQPVLLTYNGTTIFEGPGKHSFGTILNSLHAYAALAEQPYPLRAGTVVTTGSLCGLVPASGPGRAVAALGGQTVEVELV